MKPIIDIPISNYYGGPSIIEYNKRYFIVIENYNGDWGIEVSPEFTSACLKEFKDKEIFNDIRSTENGWEIIEHK